MRSLIGTQCQAMVAMVGPHRARRPDRVDQSSTSNRDYLHDESSCHVDDDRLNALHDGVSDGRWKLGGDGSCYWDPDDSVRMMLANQGRWKLGGDGSCYCDPADSGPNQCSPPAAAGVQPRRGPLGVYAAFRSSGASSPSAERVAFRPESRGKGAVAARCARRWEV